MHVAIYSAATDPDVAVRHAAALLHLCITHGWSPTVACRDVTAVAAVLAAGTVHTVVAVSPTPALVDVVTAAGGVLEAVRPGPAGAGAPPSLAAAVAAMVHTGRLTPDEAAVLLHAAGGGRRDPGDAVHRRPARPC